MQRLILYQTTRPGRFMAVDMPRRRTLCICATDSWGIWDVLSANMTVRKAFASFRIEWL